MISRYAILKIHVCAVTTVTVKHMSNNNSLLSDLRYGNLRRTWIDAAIVQVEATPTFCVVAGEAKYRSVP